MASRPASAPALRGPASRGLRLGGARAGTAAAQIYADLRLELASLKRLPCWAA